MVVVFRLFILSGLIGLTGNAFARTQDNHLVSICGRPGVTIKEEINIGDSTRVSLRQGAMLRIAGPGSQPTPYLLQAEMEHLGIKKDCAEYFLSLGKPDDISGRVYFRFDKDTLTPASVAVLNSLLEKLQSAHTHILLEGHTDASGSDNYNFALGLRRATTVQHYLAAHQIAPENMQVISYGESHPIASNSTADGRRLNRRVDISVTEE